MIPRLNLQLKSLSLTKILAPYQKEAQKAAQDKISSENYLARLVEMEAMSKLDRAITAKIHKARSLPENHGRVRLLISAAAQ